MSARRQLLAEDVLEAMLAETAETLVVPENGARNAVGYARRVAAGRENPRRKVGQLWGPGRLVAAGGALAAVAVIGVAIAHGGHAGSAAKAVSSPAVAAVAPPKAAPAAGAASAARGPESQTFEGLSASLDPGALAPKAAASLPKTTVGTTSSAVIIRTGNATLVVPKGGVATAVSQLEAAAQGLGGFLQDSSVQPTSATVTLRVPAAAFETLLARLPAIGKVATSSSSSQDVTGQTVDLAARLKAAQASRDTYLTLLSRATTIGDTLSVQQRLDDLQTQIEQLQGQQKTLAAQANDATLAVSVGEPAAPPPPPGPKPTPPRTGFNLAIHQAYDSFRNGLQDVVAASGGLLLFAIALLLLVPFVKVGMRFYRRSLL